MAIHVGYQSASRPGGGATPGAKALMSWYLGAYADRAAPAPANLGIHVVKRLGSGWSIHAEGRAADLGTKPYRKPPWGWTLANKLREHSRELGVQAVIYDRRIWSGAYPYAGWRPYNGVDSHTGHLHVELTWGGAETLTVARLQQVIGGPARPPAPTPSTSWTREVVSAMNTVNLTKVTAASSTWVKGAEVRRLQGLLLADGYGPAGLAGGNGRPDGVAGPATRKLLGQAQRKHRTGKPTAPGTPDYVAGAGTWRALLGVAGQG